MDSKHTSEEELPPPYSVHTGNRASATQAGSVTSHLQENLSFLPTRIRMNQEAHSVQQSLDDASLLDFLLPEIDKFLSNLGSLRITPSLSHLVLIPKAAVPPNAILSGVEEMRQRGELCRVAFVNTNPSSDEKKPSPGNRDSKPGGNNTQDWPAGREFSDWGRFGDSASATDPSQAEDMLWWRDEKMAGRLAHHLQLTTTRDEPVPPLQTPVQATVEERLPAQKAKKGWFWNRSGSTSSSTSTFATKSVQAIVETFPGKETVTPAAAKSRDKNNSGAKMTVTAEEVAFRTENAFGIMESVRGWAVMVVVRVKT
ncbi:hypothetical protein F4825DRAFT_168652 [Nemania diffusa]|nr:hypothetical protein F4825DRAFT_168652 [Nemania diffusa]